MLDRVRRPLALVIALSTAVFVTLPPAAAADGAVLGGKVLDRDGATPRAGVVVHLVEPAGERSWASPPTDAAGAFRVENVPAGTYRVVAEGAEGAYLAAAPVEMRAGENRPLALTLGAPTPALAAQGEAPDAAVPQQGGGLPRWSKWVIAGGIAVAALFVINEVTQDDEDEASPF